MSKLDKISTLCVKDIPSEKEFRSHALGIFPSSSFEFQSSEESIDAFLDTENHYVYSRYANPTVEAASQKLANLEAVGTSLDPGCCLTSSGMGAISTLLLAVLKPGDTVLTKGNIYGGTTELLLITLAKYNIQSKFTDLSDTDELRRILQDDPTIRLVYCETPSNPTLDVLDIQALTDVCQEFKIKTAIDNTFATPIIQRPFSLGIDYIVHSTTKYLNGHGNSVSGAILTRTKSEMFDSIWPTLKLLGPTANPFDAWLLNSGMKTLAVRLERQCHNAHKISELLGGNSSVSLVNYPGLKTHPTHDIATRQMKYYGAMISFSLSEGYDAALKFMNGLKMISIAATLGDVDTIVLHPASSSHLRVPKKMRELNGITDGLVRISVGIEDHEDIWRDISTALDKA